MLDALGTCDAVRASPAVRPEARRRSDLRHGMVEAHVFLQVEVIGIAVQVLVILMDGHELRRTRYEFYPLA